MEKQSGYTWKLGMFVTIGLLLFIMAVYFIGKQQNLFGSTFHITSQFKTVSGLEVGNNVRFSGINVGTVEQIQLKNDSTVMVVLVMKEDVRKFIKTDATASIGSDGLMGDKVLTISPGQIASVDGIEMQDIMKSVKKSVDNIGVISDEIAIFSHNMNNGNGALARLVKDDKMANSVSNTLSNLETGTKGFSENMEAAKSNFLFRGYFKKKEKEKKEKEEERLEKQEEAKKEKQEKKEERLEKQEEAKKEKQEAKKEKQEARKEKQEARKEKQEEQQKQEEAKKAEDEKK